MENTTSGTGWPKGFSIAHCQSSSGYAIGRSRRIMQPCSRILIFCKAGTLLVPFPRQSFSHSTNRVQGPKRLQGIVPPVRKFCLAAMSFEIQKKRTIRSTFVSCAPHSKRLAQTLVVNLSNCQIHKHQVTTGTSHYRPKRWLNPSIMLTLRTLTWCIPIHFICHAMLLQLSGRSMKRK